MTHRFLALVLALCVSHYACSETERVRSMHAIDVSLVSLLGDPFAYSGSAVKTFGILDVDEKGAMYLFPSCETYRYRAVDNALEIRLTDDDLEPPQFLRAMRADFVAIQGMFIARDFALTGRSGWIKMTDPRQAARVETETPLYLEGGGLSREIGKRRDDGIGVSMLTVLSVPHSLEGRWLALSGVLSDAGGGYRIYLDEDSFAYKIEANSIPISISDGLDREWSGCGKLFGNRWVQIEGELRIRPSANPKECELVDVGFVGTLPQPRTSGNKHDSVTDGVRRMGPGNALEARTVLQLFSGTVNMPENGIVLSGTLSCRDGDDAIYAFWDAYNYRLKENRIAIDWQGNKLGIAGSLDPELWDGAFVDIDGVLRRDGHHVYRLESIGGISRLREFR